MKVAIVMGSKSDYPVVEKAEAMLREFGVDYETRIISAHRTPKQAEEFAANAEANGFGTIIAAPKGVPVATVAINGAENAAILAVQILAAGDPALRQKIKDFKKRQEEEIIALDHEFQNQK